jgi:hypothetical protein
MKTTKIRVKNTEGKQVLFYHCAGHLRWPRILSILARLGITPSEYLISVNHIGKTPMTSIKAFNSKGNVVYHFTTPRNLTNEEITQDLHDWAVDPETHNVMVKRNEEHD